MSPGFEVRLLALLLWLCISAAQGGEATIAVVGDDDTSEFCDQVGLELNRLTACNLVERNQLEALAKEASLAGTRSPKESLVVARLAKADGLIFVTRDKLENGHPALVLRLTGADDALVRRSLIFPWVPGESARLAITAAALFAAPVSQMSRLSERTGIIAISLLGIRADIDTTELRETEKVLNALVCRRLADVAGLAVTERWKMDDLVFEQSLSVGLPAKPRAGSLFLAGTFSEHQGVRKFHIQVRAIDSGAEWIHVFESRADDMEGVVDAITKALAQDTQSTVFSSRGAAIREATSFASHGAWLLKHGLCKEAAEAYESALAMGDASRGTLEAATRVCAESAYPVARSHYYVPGIEHRGISKSELPWRLYAAARAMSHAEQCQRTDEPLASDKRACVEIGLLAIERSASLLKYVHETGLQLDHGLQVGTVRSGMRRLFALLDEVSIGANGMHSLGVGSLRAEYAPYWCDTPEETLQYYSRVFRLDDPQMPSTWPVVLRGRFHWPPDANGPYWEGAGPDLRYVDVGHPRLIDWTSVDQAKVRRMWQSYVETMIDSTSLVTVVDGLCFYARSKPDHVALRARVAGFLENLIEHRDLLKSREGEIVLSGGLGQLVRALSDWRSENERVTHMFVPVCQYAFSERDWVPLGGLKLLEQMVDEMALAPTSKAASEGRNHASTVEEATALEAVFSRYVERARNDQRWGHSFETVTKRLREELRERMEQSGNSASNASDGAFEVKDFWSVYRDARSSLGREQPTMSGCLATSGQDLVWTASDGRLIFGFDAQTLETKVVSAFKGRSRSIDSVHDIVATKGNVYIAGRNQIWQYDIHAQTAVSLNLPPTTYYLNESHGTLLIGFGGAARNAPAGEAWAQGSGLGEFVDGAVRWRVSTRRRPLLHPLDGLEVTGLIGSFAEPGEAMWAVFQNDKSNPVYRLDHPNAPEFVLGNNPVVRHDAGTTLIWDNFGDERDGPNSRVWVTDARAASPELWVRTSSTTNPSAGAKTRWEVGESFWPTSGREFCLYSMTVHGDELWMARHWALDALGKKRRLELCGFLPGRKDPVIIPLRFAPSDRDIESIPSNLLTDDLRFRRPFVLRNGMIATPRGLVLSGTASIGAWILPWADLHRWIAARPTG